MPILRPHNLAIALLQPQIAPNTGNIGRLCVATGSHLHLVRPMGFVLSDQKLKRSVMDYWPRLKLTIHDDTEAFFASLGARRFWLFTTKSSTSYWNAQYEHDNVLIFGSETSGIDDHILQTHPSRTLRIPQVEGERCLNLSTAAGIALYGALRHLAFG